MQMPLRAEMPLHQKARVFLWSLYDFANSIVIIVFLFYFSQWLVIDSGKPDWWFNATMIVSSLAFIIVAPILARRIDLTGSKIIGLRVTTAISFSLYLATSLICIFSPSQVLLATIMMTGGLTIYLLSFLYYTPMIRDISSAENFGKVSGLGQCANYVGQVAGLLAIIPFANGTIHFFGEPGRAQTLLPATILFGLFSLPMLVWYREVSSKRIQQEEASSISFAGEYRNLASIIKKIASVPNLALLFIAYFLYSDALLTFGNNFPIFLEKVYGTPDAIKTYISAGILLMSAVGSYVFGKISDRFGRVKTLKAILLCWCFLFVSIALVPPFSIMVALCMFAGLFYGPVWGISRSMVAQFTPPEISASSFSFYIIAERFATFVGPIIWSVVLASTAVSGVKSYSYAILSMGVLVLAGFLLTRRITKN
jgi:MFS transporter, UMF1 family